MITRINERRRPLSLVGDIADLSVTTAKLANSAVTEQKLNSALQTQLANFNTRLLVLEPTTASLRASSLAIASGTSTLITPVFTGRVTSRTITSNAITLLSGDQIISNVPFSSGILTVDTSFTLLTIDRHGDRATSTITISAVLPPTASLLASNGITTFVENTSTTLNIQFANGTPTFDGQALLPNGQPITNNGTFTVTPPRGTTRYTLTVTDSIGRTATSFVDYTVTAPLPTASLLASNGITNLFQGDSTTLNIQFANGTPTFNGQALLPNGQPITNNGTFTVTPPLGTTRYTLTVTNAFTGQTATSFVDYIVTVRPPPTASLLASNGITNLFQGDSTTLNIQFANGTPTFNGQALLPNGQPITNTGTFTVTPPVGTTRYTLTVTNATGQTATSFVDYIVTARPPPTASLLASNGITSLVENTSTTLNIQFANGTPTFNGQALLPNGQPITNNGTFTVTPPLGNTRYTLTVTNAFTGQTTSSFVDYTVAAPLPTASLLASNGIINLLQGDSTTINIQFTNGTPTFDGQALLPNGQPITNNGTYTVTPPVGNTRYLLTVTNATGQVSQAVIDYSVTARPPPTASLLASNGITSLVENTSTTLNIQFANGTPTFNGQALLPNGQPITNNGTFTVTPPLGNTRYTLTVTNAFTGQTATSFVDYTVTAAPTGWYGNIVMELLSIRSPGDVVAYNYTIYRGSTTSATPIATNVTVTNNQGNGAVIARVTRVDESERLPNSSSTFLVVVNRESINNGDLGFISNNVTGGTITSLTGFYTANINPTAANNANITIRFYISDP